jgi:hypothetical protein
MALTQGLSAANTKIFEQTFVDLMKAANLGMSNSGRRGGSGVEFNESAKQWRVIMDIVKDEYGDPVTQILQNHKFGATPPQLQSQVCSARIRQIGLILRQPAPMAASLIGGAMR